MALWQSIPFACILLPLGSAAITSALPPKWARRWTFLVLILLTAASAYFLTQIAALDLSYTYRMGHYSAPWGNEIRAGQMEALCALLFSLVMLLCVIGGLPRIEEEISEKRQSLYCVMLLLMESALMAQVYTNDLFTAYVFIEIMATAGCSLIAARTTRGRATVAAARYMIMNMIGSSLFLLGVILLYDLTGHLLMSNIQEQVRALYESGQYHLPLTVAVALLSSGLAVKSALYPFHSWVPDAYGTSTAASASILSALISKGYIVLLIKVVYRVITPEIYAATGVDNILLIFGVAGVIMGSVHAIRQTDPRRMIAYSSVAQIGYIYMGLGLHTTESTTAAVFHILAHSVCKAMLFLAVSEIRREAGGARHMNELRGAGHQAPLAAAAFTVGALSMVGFPFLGGFSSKICFAQAAVACGGIRGNLVLAALIVSALLNVGYFLRAVIILWGRPLPGASAPAKALPHHTACVCSLILLMGCNVALGVLARPVLHVIVRGLAAFG